MSAPKAIAGRLLGAPDPSKIDEAHDDLRRLVRAVEAACMKLDSLGGHGVEHHGVDNTTHLGPASPCPTCERIERGEP